MDRRAYFHALADGLMCADDKRLASSEISAESRVLAGADVSRPSRRPAGRALAQGRREPTCGRFAIQILQRHIEKKLVTASMLQKSDF